MPGDQVLLVVEKRGHALQLELDLVIFWNKIIFIVIAVVIL